MKIRFLGKWSSNIVAGERNVSFALDDKIIFDFGPHALESLLESKVDPRKAEVIAITHMHLDHFSGLPELFWYRAIYKAENRLMVLGPKGIKNNTEKLLKLLHTPEEFKVDAEFIEDEDYEFIRHIKANHTIVDNGYRIEYGGKTLFYTGDTAYSKNVVNGSQDVDMLVHEMTYTDNGKKEADFWKHSTYSTTMQVFEESHAKRLVPVHLTVDSDNLVKGLLKSNKMIIYPAGIIDL
ncbi:MAG: ribonuclease Z [Candidatus Micrarchaeaceae archaeon]